MTALMSVGSSVNSPSSNYCLSPQQILRRLHASNNMLYTCTYLPALLASLPSAWVDAAHEHAQLLQSGEPQPEQVAAVMTAMVASCRLVQDTPLKLVPFVRV